MESFGTVLSCLCIAVSVWLLPGNHVSAGCSDEDFAKSHELLKQTVEEKDSGAKKKMFEEAFRICPEGRRLAHVF